MSLHTALGRKTTATMPPLIVKPDLTAGGAGVQPEAKAILLAMLFGVTLGGNASMIWAVPNIIAVTAARKAGESVSFSSFARVGVPVAIVQFVAVAIWISWKI